MRNFLSFCFALSSSQRSSSKVTADSAVECWPQKSLLRWSLLSSFVRTLWSLPNLCSSCLSTPDCPSDPFSRSSSKVLASSSKLFTASASCSSRSRPCSTSPLTSSSLHSNSASASSAWWTPVSADSSSNRSPPHLWPPAWSSSKRGLCPQSGVLTSFSSHFSFGPVFLRHLWLGRTSASWAGSLGSS